MRCTTQLLLLVCLALVARSATSQDLRLVVISDLNERYGDQFHREEVHNAIESIITLSPDLVLIAGDMVAGQRAGLDYAGMWAGFERAVLEPLSSIPIAVTPGNHDAPTGDQYAGEREVYRGFWGERRPDSNGRIRMVDGSDYPMRYSFALGPILFISLEATSRTALRRGDQLDWLETQLQWANTEELPLRILIGHVPLLPFSQDRQGSYLLRDEATRNRVERMLDTYDVNLVISGHHHAYYPGRYPDLPVRLLGMGCLGGGPRVLLGDDRELSDTNDPTERSFAVIEISGQEINSVEAYQGPGFGTEDRIDRTGLPTEVGEDELRVVRDDL